MVKFFSLFFVTVLLYSVVAGSTCIDGASPCSWVKLYYKPYFWFFLVNAFFSAPVAKEKGYRDWVWYLNGLIFGPIGLLAACGLPDRLTHKRLKDIEDL